MYVHMHCVCTYALCMYICFVYVHMLCVCTYALCMYICIVHVHMHGVCIYALCMYVSIFTHGYMYIYMHASWPCTKSCETHMQRGTRHMYCPYPHIHTYVHYTHAQGYYCPYTYIHTYIRSIHTCTGVLGTCTAHTHTYIHSRSHDEVTPSQTHAKCVFINIHKMCVYIHIQNVCLYTYTKCVFIYIYKMCVYIHIYTYTKCVFINIHMSIHMNAAPIYSCMHVHICMNALFA